MGVWSQLCSRGSPLRLGSLRESGRGGADPGGAGRGPVSAGVGSWRGWGRASHLCSRGSPLRLGTPISCAPGSPRIGIQWAQRRGADHGSGHWDCVEQGTTYSALCWHILGAPPPGGRRKASPLGSRPLPLHPSAEKSPSLRGFPKQPRVRWKSKGQNPESWLAGPALLLALCRPAGPGAPAGMGKGRVHELHPRNLVGCMDFKPWWPPRQQRRGSKELEIKTPFSIDLLLKVQKQIVLGEDKSKIGLRGPMPPGILFAVYDSKTGRPEYIPPEYVDIPLLLKELEDYINNSDDHPIIKAAILHYQLVTIHPFEDGNGRTARIMSNYILSYYGYGFKEIGSLEEYFSYDLEEYYSSLQMGLPVLYYEGRDNPPHPEIWIDYFVKVFSLYSEKVLKIATSSVNDNEKQRFNQLSIKAKNLLNYLKEEQILEFSPIELAPIFNVSNRTIINWCIELCENGYLKPNMVNKRIRTYTLVC